MKCLLFLYCETQLLFHNHRQTLHTFFFELKLAIKSPVLLFRLTDGIVEVESTAFILSPNRHAPAPVYQLNVLYHGGYMWQLIAVLQLNYDA